MDYFYPRPLRRGRLAADTRGLNYVVISIHALFAEGDEYKRIIAGYIDISIHALFAEGDSKYAQFNSAYLINLYIS